MFLLKSTVLPVCDWYNRLWPETKKFIRTGQNGRLFLPGAGTRTKQVAPILSGTAFFRDWRYHSFRRQRYTAGEGFEAPGEVTAGGPTTFSSPSALEGAEC